MGCADASSDMLRRSARCTQSGGMGATIQIPRGRVARMTGLGTGTVHKLKREMAAQSQS